MICYPSHEIFRYQKLLHAFKTLRTILVEVTPLYFTYAKHKTHRTLVTHLFNILIVRQENLGTKEYCTFPITNFSYTPKPMQRHYKLNKIQKNGIIGIIYFFGKIFCLQLIVEEKILKHRFSSGGVISPNQRFRQRNKYLQRLNEDKDFFTKFILVTRHREG